MREPERRSIETIVSSSRLAALAGVLLFAAAIAWASIEFWRHGTIHAISGLFVFAMIFIGLSLFAGLERVSASLRAIAMAIREARGRGAQ